MSISITYRPTLVDRLVKRSLVADLLLVLSGTAITALAAQLYIPNEPVPFTFQTLAVLLVGSALGSTRGAASMFLYAVLGGAGLPLFSEHSSGWNVLFGATGGYIIGFIIAAALVGWLAEKGWSQTGLGMLGSYAIGSLVIYALGSAWLTYAVLGGEWLGAQGGLAYGVIPFLAFDAIKAFVAAAILPEAWRLVGKLKG